MENIWSVSLIQKAWHFASQKHKGQIYGGKEKDSQVEYLSHVGAVTFELMACFAVEKHEGQELALCCSLLHDTIEDTNASFEEIKTLFGEIIANGVLALSKDDSIENKEQKMFDSLCRIKKQSKAVWLVKLADRICNMKEPLEHWSISKRDLYYREAEMIYNELKDASPYLAKRLRLKMDNYK